MFIDPNGEPEPKLDPKLDKLVQETLDQTVSVVITANYNKRLESALNKICTRMEWLGDPEMGLIAADVPVSKVRELLKIDGVVAVELDDTLTIQ